MDAEERKYAPFVEAIHSAGFFTAGVEPMGDWDRVLVCSKRAGEGFGGHSFWVTLLSDGWILGTWGGLHYRIGDQDRVAPFCIAWLIRHPDRIQTEIDADTRQAFDLLEITDDEFDRLVAAHQRINWARHRVEFPLSDPRMVIRAATLADAPAIAAIHVTAWQTAYAGVIPQAHLEGLSAAAREAEWKYSIESRESQIQVALIDDKVAGWVSFGPCRDAEAPPETAEIWGIYVSPTKFRQGIGRDLMRVALSRLQRQGFVAVTLWVLAQNEGARRFYERVGFQPATDSLKTVDIGGARLEAIRF